MAEQNPAKRVLFMTNSEYGQANVILAVAYEFLLRQKYDVHVASFAPLKCRIPELNELASSNSGGKASAATFHLITGLSAQEALLERDEFIGPFPPGIRGAKDSYRVTLPAMATTWEGPEYMSGYASCIHILNSVNPDIIACDPLMSQGLEACKARSRDVVVLSPNTFREIMGKQQPFLSTLFRYPVFVLPFPQTNKGLMLPDWRQHFPTQFPGISSPPTSTSRSA